jgi:hypothetical protein
MHGFKTSHPTPTMKADTRMGRTWMIVLLSVALAACSA